MNPSIAHKNLSSPKIITFLYVCVCDVRRSLFALFLFVRLNFGRWFVLKFIARGDISSSLFLLHFRRLFCSTLLWRKRFSPASQDQTRVDYTTLCAKCFPNGQIVFSFVIVDGTIFRRGRCSAKRTKLRWTRERFFLFRRSPRPHQPHHTHTHPNSILTTLTRRKCDECARRSLLAELTWHTLTHTHRHRVERMASKVDRRGVL